MTYKNELLKQLKEQQKKKQDETQKSLALINEDFYAKINSKRGIKGVQF